MRGVRFAFARHLGHAPDFGSVRRIAARIAPLGWHLVLHLEPEDVVEFADLLPAFSGSARRASLLREEGRIDVAALLEGFVRGARAAGVRVRTGARVGALTRRGQRVTGVVLEDGERVEAERVVLAAGGWAGKLGRKAGSRVALRPTRRHLLVTEPDQSIDPRGPVLWSDPDGFYARPESGGWLLCACDQSEVDPDAWCADESVRERICRCETPAAVLDTIRAAE